MSAIRDNLALYDLSVRVARDRGGPVAPAVGDKADLTTKRIRHLLVLVHGFNNSREEAEKSFDSLIGLLRPGLAESRVAPDAVARFQWPGNAAVGPFSELDFLGYPVDIDRARESAKRLADYLTFLYSPWPGAMRISLIGHSLGCRLLLEALAEQRKASAMAPPIEVMCLMAPAVPVELVGTGQPLEAVYPQVRATIKAISSDDLVLRVAFPAGQLLAYLMGIEKSWYDEALGRHGNPGSYAEPLPTHNGHGGYWSDRKVADAFLRKVDQTVPRPLEERAIPTRDMLTEATVAARELPVPRSVAV